MQVLGTWNIRISTPIGRFNTVYEFTETPDGLLGVARNRGEETLLEEVAATSAEAGELVTWTQSITRPMRLNLAFDVTVNGDVLEGVSKAGKLPSSAVTGERVAAAQG